jgi:hypothetical protein
MHKVFFTLLITLYCSSAIASSEQQIAKLLDQFHLSASQANYQSYFDSFGQQASFIGTDASEYWTKAEFAEYTKKRFASGQGWTYKSTSRHITLDNSGEFAWFHELLINEKYGLCRGTGIVTKTGSGWKIQQYNLSVPLPNEMMEDLTEQIILFSNKKNN